MTTQNVFLMTDTWNAGATTFSAIKMTATDTASAAGSMLLDLQLASGPIFQVRKDGHVSINGGSFASLAILGANTFTGVQKLPDGSAGAPSIASSTAPTNGIAFNQGGQAGIQVIGGGFISYLMDQNRFRIRSNMAINWSSGSDPTATGPDTGLERSSAGVVKINSGESASAGGALITGDPTSGDGPAWKFGARKAATVVADTTQYLEVKVAGTTYKVGIVN